VTRFTFRPKDGEPVPELQAGKFTTIWVPMNDEGPHGQYTEQPRHYTLNAARNDEERSKALCISVKKDGAVSGILHVAEVGSEWEMSAPFGCFLMAGVEQLWVSAPDTPVVFMSGGIGMTPGKNMVILFCVRSDAVPHTLSSIAVMAMLENVYSTHPASWLHVNKNGGVHAYRERLRDITSVKNGDLKRRIWYTAPRQEDGEPGDMSYPDTFNSANYHFKGRMDLNNEELLSSHVLHLDNPNTHYFMCGPSEFMDDQKAVLMKMGVVESRIHSEGF
jgi:nitric oxide dioxygenase